MFLSSVNRSNDVSSLGEFVLKICIRVNEMAYYYHHYHGLHITNHNILQTLGSMSVLDHHLNSCWNPISMILWKHSCFLSCWET